MAKPVTRARYDTVKRLLRENLSVPVIARRSGESETTVRKIARGTIRRPAMVPRTRKSTAGRRSSAAASKPMPREKFSGPQFRSVPQYRCTDCGSIVLTAPCVNCAAERAKLHGNSDAAT